MRSSLKPSLKTSDVFQFPPQNKSPSCCSPRSLNDLRVKHAVFSDKQPSKLKLKTEYMEVGESSFVQQIYDKDYNKEIYNKYKENFKKIIVDDEGNYLYTKMPRDYGKEIAREFQNKGNSSLGYKEYSSFIEKKLHDLEKDKSDVENLHTSENEVYYLRKKLKKKNGDSPRNKKKMPMEFINSLKEGVYQKMNDFLTLKNKKEVITSSKQQLDTVVREYSLIIEKLTKENQNLMESTTKMKLQVEETVELSDFLKRKNVLLVEQLQNLQMKYEQQLNMNSELEQFQKGMKMLNEKYPQFTLEKLMNRYAILEETSLDLSRKISELEDDMRKSENDRIKQINELQEKIMTFADTEKKREKELQEFQIRLNNQKFDKEEAQNYKEKYFVIFKRIVALFNSWNNKIRVYYTVKEDLPESENVILEDPLHVLDVLDKMVRISTPESLQQYLRKIIISANKLQRNHFKQFVNERFDPEKLYERIDKKMEALEKKKIGESGKMKVVSERFKEKIFLE